MAEVLRILYSNINALKDMNGSDENHLREVAQLCPIDDGPGVYVARAALLKLDTLPKHFISECEFAPSPERMSEKRDEEEGNGRFTVYPNPNNGRVMVNYNLGKGETGIFAIYSVLGELVVKRPLNGASGHMELILPNVNSGIYLLTLEVNGEPRLIERLSILTE